MTQENWKTLDQRLLAPEMAAIAERLGDPATATAEAIRWLEEGVREAEALEGGAPRSAAEVLDWLNRNGGSARDRWAALRGRLGIDVVRERIASALAAIDHRERLLLGALSGRLPAGDDPPTVVVGRLQRGRHWRVRQAAAETLAQHLAAGGRPGEALTVTKHVADSPMEHPWVRDACDGVLCAADPAAGLAHLLEGLTPQPEPRHFLLRRLRVARIAAVALDQSPALLRRACSDPSEHVRIGLAETASAIGAVMLIRALAEDPSERVRLAAIEYASRVGPRYLGGWVVERVAVERAPLVLTALARAAERAAQLVWPDETDRLMAAMDELIAADHDGAVTEAATAARRVCARADDGPRGRLYDRLRARIPQIQPGRHARLSWAELGIERDQAAARLGPVLAELARDDFGLSADIGAVGITLWRGERRRFQPWRLLHELRHPAPNKRQSWSHVVGRAPRGAIRAPPGGMAEVTPTAVPGERHLIDAEGSWVPLLPTPDDLLHLPGPTAFHSSAGSALLIPPRGWIRRWLAWFQLTVRYAWFARLRTTSLQSDTPSERRRYVSAIEDLGISVIWRLDAPAPRRFTTLQSPILAAAPWLGWLTGAREALLAPSPVSQPALAWFAGALLALLLTTAAVRRESLRAARDAIPLVIGGWGTRGKSGTERMKAGLFHGLGFGVVSKTTGCEAMIVVARPGSAPREIFLHRPHDKSTIWEQAGVVKQAAAMGAQVLLWECMALRPHLVSILQHDWMRDDVSTLTNAFPDHEDLQGPTGADVANVISEFIPYHSTAITTEREFLPLFRERAAERGTALDAVDVVEGELLGDDLLALFPYSEHPRNIALAARMAERLGVPRDLAIVLMAEHVVPDLGVLRTFPAVRVRGRILTFINGMSANERAGCLGNWRRTGCDRIDVDGEQTRAVVLVVNNRADRPARSRVFARLVVEDLTADAVVVIGTAVDLFVRQVERALDDVLSAVVVRAEEGDASGRVGSAFRRVRVGRPSVLSLLTRATAAAAGLGCSAGDLGPLGSRLTTTLGSPGVGWDVAGLIRELREDAAWRADWDRAIGPRGAALVPPEVAEPPSPDEAWALWVEALAGQILHARAQAAAAKGTLSDDTLRAVVRALWLLRLRPVTDPKTTGDQVIAVVASAVQPGLDAVVMGIQNIKGTGLDFAYRWVALGGTHSRVEETLSADRRVRFEALRALDGFDDYGWVDSGLAVARIAPTFPDADGEELALRQAVLTRVRTIHQERARALGRVAARTPVAALLEQWLDPIDAVFRYFAAQRLMRRLRHHTISLGDAAREMLRLVDRQKGGWLRLGGGRRDRAAS